MKETIKTFAVFTAIAIALLLYTYRHILDSYAFLDDYFLLYNATDKIFLPIFDAAGRPLYGVVAKWLYSKLDYICEVKYFRIGSLIGIILFSALLNRAYILAGWRRVEGACAALITCLMPAFGLYAAWATTLQVAYGASLAFIAGELCLKSYNCMTLENNRLKAIVMISVIVLLLMISLMLYQPSTPAFWLFVAIALFKPQKNSEELFHKSMYCFVIFGISATVYYIMYKATIWPFTVEASARSAITINPIEKIHWFVKGPMYDALSLFNILQGKTVIATTVTAVSSVILGGLFFRIKRSKQQKWPFVLIFFSLIPLSYLPNLVSTDCWAAFRTQGVLGSLVVFYFLLSLKDIFRSRVTRVIMPCLLAAFSLMAYKNVTYGFVEPQKQELNIIRHALQESLLKQPRKIIFIRSHWSDSLAAKVRYDEYGLPSTSAPWVPKRLINLLAREYKGAAFLPIKVYNFKHDYKVSPKEEIAIINAGKLLQEYKQTVPKNKFYVSNDIRLVINNTKGFGDLKPLHQLSFQYRPDGIVLISNGNDPYFALPLFNFPSEKDLVVKIDITSPKDTVLQLYYATKSVPHYSEKQSIRRKITKGNNVVFIQLPPKDYTGHFRLDPGKIVGEFLLHSIEIRGISKG